MSAELPQKKVIEHPQLDPSTGFDYRTHIKDAATGKLIRIQNYARHARGGEVLLERPVGSGNCFAENGESIGRFRFVTEGKETIPQKISDDHIEVAPAPTNHMEDLTQRNSALESELAALRAEAEAARKAQKQATVQKA